MDRYNDRQSSIVDSDELLLPIRIIGAGGIGSWTTLALAKLGCKDITVQDFDTVEDVNVGSQLFGPKHIGKYKVNALKEIVEELTGTSIGINKLRWSKGQHLNESLLISALDSLDTRRDLWQDIKTNENITNYIDSRMAGENIRILNINLLKENDIAFYEKTIDPSIRVDHEPCTARAIVYNTFTCASVIANLVKRLVMEQEAKRSLILDLSTQL